jgi:hypothetical protein
MMNIKTLWLMVGSLLFVPGCLSQIQDAGISSKNHCWAHFAWKLQRPSIDKYCAPRPLVENYGKGWRRGYYDVAMGGGGQVPLLPPNCYWGIGHMNPLGHEEIRAWFAGYQDGAMAAKQDGVGFWSRIMTSCNPKNHETEQRGTEAPVPAEEVPPGNPLDLQPTEELPRGKVTGMQTGDQAAASIPETFRK